MDKNDCRKFYDFDEDDDIGEGGFGRVYKAKKKGTNEERALKIIKKKKIKDNFKAINRRNPTDEELKKNYKDIYEEIKFMKLMENNNENKNTVKFYESFENDKEFVIVMEYCEQN